MTARGAKRQLSLGVTALLTSAILVAAGCGGDEEARGLVQSRADTLLDLLDDAEQQFDDGECDELNSTLDELAQEVNAVDNEVDESIRTALQTETQDLVDLASQDCEEPEVTTETVPAPVPPPTTIETVAPTTETEPTTEETETEPEVPEEEPEGEGPDGEGPPGQEEQGDADVKEPKPPKEPEEAEVEREKDEEKAAVRGGQT